MGVSSLMKDLRQKSYVESQSGFITKGGIIVPKSHGVECQGGFIIGGRIIVPKCLCQLV